MLALNPFCLHKILVGTVPFGPCETPVEVYECIIRGQIRYNDIAGLSAPARDIIQGLLQVDRTRRLGNMRDGERDVKNHLWVSDAPCPTKDERLIYN